ncbi:alpha/beta fold hydrolase [Paracoccus sp. DMF-8]|uniref:alpha/beta fold hydrolase n=1 Tax=Paracoccus sp. DMF-8 TaxID=3019445 RepID=UPI0023E87E35|nr:alpha/beta fold hydrolase [Paracoccus sp. DMF-8]MDF3604911.1 alpha/beta fold hydrolase [Paracoccus sp. DMF-8]
MQIRISGGVLDCLVAGTHTGRPSLVLLHGIQGTALVWKPLLADLSRDRLVVAPHLRGRAGSYSPDDAGQYALADFAGDLRAVLAALPGPAVLVGWSMGCLIALEYLRGTGVQDLAGLVLVSGSPCLAATGGQDAVWFQGDTVAALARNAADRAKRLQLTETATNIAVAGSWLAARAADYRDVLPRIALPTLILHGADDPECPVAHARIMRDAIPGAKLRLWPGCGHVPMAHDPAAFARELAGFLPECG